MINKTALLKEMIVLADTLDDMGLMKEAFGIDGIIEKIASLDKLAQAGTILETALGIIEKFLAPESRMAIKTLAIDVERLAAGNLEGEALYNTIKSIEKVVVSHMVPLFDDVEHNRMTGPIVRKGLKMLATALHNCVITAENKMPGVASRALKQALLHIMG